MNRPPVSSEERSNFFQPAASPAVEDERLNQCMKLNNLSLKERESGIEDLHGVADIMDEDPSVVQKCVEELRKELNPSESSSIATDDSELLKFLRAESFDVGRAAARFRRFADFQRKLFGKEGKVAYSDLNDDDVKYLQSGFVQLLPQRDRAGRAILMGIGSIKQQLRTSLESDVSNY